jgi:hypothetical protein
MASQAGEQVMHDIGIIAIGPIVTELESDTQARKISIDVLTSDGQNALEMSAVLAMELAAKRWSKTFLASFPSLAYEWRGD